MNVSKTVTISHCTEAPWPLHENERTKELAKGLSGHPPALKGDPQLLCVQGLGARYK